MVKAPGTFNGLTVDQFNKYVPEMMSYFYRVWAGNNKKEAAFAGQN